MPRLEEIRKGLCGQLRSFGVEETEARRQMELIVEHALGFNLSQQILHAYSQVGVAQLNLMQDIIAQRKQHIPLQYCLGHTVFMGFKLACRPGVLIARVDTEMLVELSLAKLKNIAKPKVVDIGCGSGAISIAVLKGIPDSEVLAIDISGQAVQLTVENGRLHNVADRLEVIHSDWLTVMPARVEAILSNPPYIPKSKAEMLPPEILLYEPEQALFGQGEDGLDFYRQLAEIAHIHLSDNGFLGLEFGDGQSEAVAEIFSGTNWREISIHNDVNGLPRVLFAYKANK